MLAIQVSDTRICDGHLGDEGWKPRIRRPTVINTMGKNWKGELVRRFDLQR